MNQQENFCTPSVLDMLQTVHKRACPQRPKKLIIEGHRGAGAFACHNTINSFKKSIDLGLDSIELDVWLSKDQ